MSSSLIFAAYSLSPKSKSSISSFHFPIGRFGSKTLSWALIYSFHSSYTADVLHLREEKDGEGTFREKTQYVLLEQGR